MLKKLQNKKGFTLVELIIVVAILAIIMMIAVANYSGIQQVMQVRSDKLSAANIGKSARVWYTMYNTDNAFKTTVNAAYAELTDTDAKTIDTGLPKPTEKMVPLNLIPEISTYLDEEFAPESLRLADDTEDTAQVYYVGIVGKGSSEKIVVSISNATKPTLPTGDVTDESVLYDGKVNTQGNDEGERSAEDHFKYSLAYLEA